MLNNYSNLNNLFNLLDRDQENSSYNMGERRRSSGGSLYKMNKAERARSLHEKGIDETLADTSLTHVTESSVKKKDFAKEVRAQRDIKSFIDNSEVLLDLPEVKSSQKRLY